MNKIEFGDCRETMRRWAAEGVRVQTCVTSPPYFGLRDYGHEGQIGLEQTPEEYITAMVEVFRCVKDVLADDGTLWLNIGDSYAGGGGGNYSKSVKQTSHGEHITNVRNRPDWLASTGLKPKDLIGIPWALAKALRDPYYAGRIKREMDRVWLAAMIDGEGCMFIHKHKAGSDSGAKFTKSDGTEVSYARKQDTYSPGLEVANTHLGIVERCKQITGLGTITRQDKDRRLLLYRWHLRADEARQIVREVYPYLIGKRQQARILCGCPTSGEQADASHRALMLLHNGSLTDVDFKDPASMHEQGWYLRQDVIWSKPNPMPESVRDRCTKAHEYIFLLSKSEKYFFDSEAMKEPAVQAGRVRADSFKGRQGGAEFHVASGGEGSVFTGSDTRNRRSVWTVATRPYKGAHFATFPPALIEPCILAGSRPGDIVLDPFMGSGTTAAVALQQGRQYLGCELNPDYGLLQQERISAEMNLFNQPNQNPTETESVIKILHGTC
jgi:DNA modification methylase